jgi:hypothetical protein
MVAVLGKVTQLIKLLKKKKRTNKIHNHILQVLKIIFVPRKVYITFLIINIGE